ncbi:MAG: hypothetical protein IJA72_02280 [Clostridia bacterium]|nr:hypothetical protein [Clostridia bacterium]
MEFLKKMKSREMVEMTLKTIAAVMAGLILIILMEGMIFGVYMNHINKNKATQWTPQTCVMYCAEQDNGNFDLYIHDVNNGSWQVKKDVEKANIDTDGYKDVIWRAPNAFDVSIKGVHFVVMALFIVAILGLYGWRFYRINKEYKGFEKKLHKTGNIFA